MHGWEGEEKKKHRRHMWPVPVLGTTTIVAAADSTIASVTSNFFCKDGRRISVGDCALFKPNQESSPPFIGIIRCLTSGKEDYLKLGVNWLYRPADVKLGKGSLLEAAPNEVFYSFHKDEIPAASLLHPCKVAFLRKGVELPAGISSFVCRRVYDTANKRLWWLTDQDYINERQEEVDKLLDKTRIEMHAAVQSGGRSPKTLNVPTAAPQLKPGSDSIQNSSTSFSSQGKGKKRDRVDQGSEPIKRERCSRTDDGDSGFRLESMLKSEIAKITDKGGLVDYDGVEKLVQLMHPDRTEKKIELSGRVMLADVISATERHECLVRFVQLRGLSVLDEWLQEVHKGKIGDVSSPKESDKPVEEFLLALLHALDKLPVNLHALQTCNVGKSVNLLRSHKNLEIQKKSRSLVDTWKKRVEAEMKINDTKSGSTQAASWANRQGIPEASQASHAGNRRPGGSSEVLVKNSVTQPSASKTAPVKLVHGDTAAKTISVSPGSVKLAASLPASVVASKDPHCKIPGNSGTSDMPLTTIREEKREEKSSSSSQSQNNSQTCSSDHAKTICGSSWKEDARSSTAGSMNANKSNGASRHRKLSNGFPGSGSGSVVPGVQKETALGKCSSVNRNNPSEKVSPSGLSCERAADLPLVDHTNSQRLIVRLPNPGRSPARSASGCSFDDPSGMASRASSPVLLERPEQGDRKVKGKSDGCRDAVTETWQSNDVKDGLVACGEANGSPGGLLGEECSRSGDEVGKALESSKGAPLSSGSDKVVSFCEPKQGKLNEASLSSINALVDSCVKASASMSVGDDVGMNLLASVAAGEMSKSELVSPIGSPRRSSPVLEVFIAANVSKSRLSCEDGAARMQGQSVDSAGGDAGKQGTIIGPLWAKDGFQHVSAHASDNVAGDAKTTATSTSEEKKPKLEHSEKLPVTSLNSQQTADPCLKSDVKPNEIIPTVPMPSVDTKEEEYKGVDQLCEKKTCVTGWNGEIIPDSKTKLKNLSEDENKKVNNADGKVDGIMTGTSGLVRSAIGDVSAVDVAASCVKLEKEAVEETPSCPSSEINIENKTLVHEGLNGTHKEQKLPLVVDHKAVKGSAGDVLLSYGSGNSSCADNAVDLKVEKADREHASSNHEPSENHRMEQASAVYSTLDDRDAAGSGLVIVGHHTVGDNSDKKVVLEHHSSLSAPCVELPSNLEQETERCVKLSGSKLSGVEADELEESASTAEASSLSVAAGTDSCPKLDFDLNEGFPVEDGTQGDAVTSTAAPGCPPVIHLTSPLQQFSLSSMSSSLPASVTVAAAAKGPFVPPEIPLRNKGGIGWKGSAATSAFRRAEPRRVLEMSLGTSDISPDVSAIKQGRLPLDIDLNVADEVLEDMASQSSAQEICSNSGRINNSGDLRRTDMFGSSVPVRSAAGFDLDLNRVDEDTDMGQFPASTNRRLEVSLLPVRQPSSGVFSNGEVNVLRDFDLNNGPGVDESSTEPASLRQHMKSGLPFLPPVAGLRMNNTDLGGLSSWFPPGNSYPAVAIPSILPDRGEQHYPIVATAGGQRILGPPTGGTTYGPDGYRGPVLSSSPAVAFSTATPYPYPGFPFGTSFSLPSTSFSGASATYIDSSTGGGLCFPAVPSQLIGPAGAVSSHYPRPYMVGLPDGTMNGGGDSSRKWVRQGLDLNAGPGGPDIEGRDERFPSASRQHSVAGSQALTEEQVRMYQAAGAVLKRKEPDGGWDIDRFSYKPPSRQ